MRSIDPAKERNVHDGIIATEKVTPFQKFVHAGLNASRFPGVAIKGERHFFRREIGKERPLTKHRTDRRGLHKQQFQRLKTALRVGRHQASGFLRQIKQDGVGFVDDLPRLGVDDDGNFPVGIERCKFRRKLFASESVHAFDDVGQTEACLVGIVFGDDETQQSIAPVVQDADGNRIEQFEPGLIAYARGGKDIKFNQPASTAGVYEWHRVQLHIIAAGWRVPYELMTGDLSQVNFSSSRVGLNEFRRMVEAMQWQMIIPTFCQPIWQWFCEAAFAAGLIPTADVPVEWAPPKFDSVNPLQDATTDLLETRAGFSTIAKQIAKRGYDPRKVLEEWQEFALLADTMNLIFDSDPRKVSRGEQVQSQDPGSLDGETSKPLPDPS